MYRKIDATMIHAIRRRPKTNPSKEELRIINAGIRKTTSARRTATIIPLRAATQTRFFNTSRTKKSVSTGNAETRVERGQ